MKYFIADLHFGHDLIAAMRQTYPGTKTLFPSVESRDEHVLGSINQVAEERDELFVIGDFSREPGRYRARIKCKHVYLIQGNHDPYMKCKAVFGSISTIKKVKLRKHHGKSMPCILSHYPQAFWDGSHRGWCHLYGHCHGQRELWMDQHLGYERRSMDMSMDNLRRVNGDYFPMSEVELYDMFMARKGHDQVEYYDALKAERDRE